MEMVDSEGVGLSWEETRGQLAPTHHGTALELLSTDSLCCDSCLLFASSSSSFRRVCSGGGRCSGLSSDPFSCRFLLLNHGWMKALESGCLLPLRLPQLSYIWCILCYSRSVSWSLCTSVKWYIYNKCKPLQEVLECIRLYKLHHNQPVFVEFCTNPDGRISFWKCCQSSVDCSIGRSCYFNCIAVQITTGILEKLSETKKCLFQHSEGIMKIINVCKPSPALRFWGFFSFHVSADVFIQDQDRRKVQSVALILRLPSFSCCR